MLTLDLRVKRMVIESPSCGLSTQPLEVYISLHIPHQTTRVVNSKKRKKKNPNRSTQSITILEVTFKSSTRSSPLLSIPSLKRAMYNPNLGIQFITRALCLFWAGNDVERDYWSVTTGKEIPGKRKKSPLAFCIKTSHTNWPFGYSILHGTVVTPFLAHSSASLSLSLWSGRFFFFPFSSKKPHVVFLFQLLLILIFHLGIWILIVLKFFVLICLKVWSWPIQAVLTAGMLKRCE